jgi:hypothetical protein
MVKGFRKSLVTTIFADSPHLIASRKRDYEKSKIFFTDFTTLDLASSKAAKEPLMPAPASHICFYEIRIF